MKIEFAENDGCFAINLTAENPVEMAKLIRFGMNRTNEIRSASTNVYRDGTVLAHVVFGKHKHANYDVPKLR